MLPSPLLLGARLFAGERVREMNVSEAIGQVAHVQRTHFLQVRHQRLAQPLGEHGGAILFALALPHHHGALLEVDVLYPQPQCFQQAQPALIEQARTSRYRNSSAQSAWFCVDAATLRSMASQVRNAWSPWTIFLTETTRGCIVYGSRPQFKFRGCIFANPPLALNSSYSDLLPMESVIASFVRLYGEYINAFPMDDNLRLIVAAPDRIPMVVLDEIPALTEGIAALDDAVKWWNENQVRYAGPDRTLRLHCLLSAVDRMLEAVGPVRFKTLGGELAVGRPWWHCYLHQANARKRLRAGARTSVASRPFANIRWLPVCPTRLTDVAFREHLRGALVRESDPTLRVGLCVLGCNAQAAFSLEPSMDRRHGVYGFRGTEVTWHGPLGESVAAELIACVRWAREAQVHVLCFPELAVDMAGREVLARELENDPGTIALVIPGSFHQIPSDGPERVNRAPAWLLGGAGHRGEGGFDKTDPFNSGAAEFTELFHEIPEDCLECKEDIRAGTGLTVIETPVGHFGIAICKDATNHTLIEGYGNVVDHLLVLSMNPRGTSVFWAQGGESIVRRHGASMLYINSAQGISKADEGADLVFTYFPQHTGLRNRLYRYNVLGTAIARAAGLPLPPSGTRHPERPAEIHCVPNDMRVLIEIPIPQTLLDGW